MGISSYLLLLTCQLSWGSPTQQAHSLERILRWDSGPIPPCQDPFYSPDGTAWQDQRPGTILKQREITVPNVASLTGIANIEHAYQLLYSTTDVFGRPSHTVTTVLVPFLANPLHHVSYQVAYDSPNHDCAPSYGLQYGSSTHAGQAQLELTLAMNIFLNQGAIVSVPDYEGSLSSFAVGPQAAMGVLDSMRAVLRSGSLTGISPLASNVMMGYSGGGFASEWAAEYHQRYAPDLAIAGAAIGGLPTNISKVVFAVNEAANAGLIPAALLGIAGTYPPFESYLKQHLTHNVSAFEIPLTECASDLFDSSYGYHAALLDADISSFFDNGFGIVTDQSPLLDEIGVMGLHGTPHFPLFVWKGTADEVAVDIEDTDALVAKYCAAGTRIEYQRYVGCTHAETALFGLLGAVTFITAIFAGVAPTVCTTVDLL